MWAISYRAKFWKTGEPGEKPLDQVEIIDFKRLFWCLSKPKFVRENLRAYYVNMNLKPINKSARTYNLVHFVIIV